MFRPSACTEGLRMWDSDAEFSYMRPRDVVPLKIPEWEPRVSIQEARPKRGHPSEYNQWHFSPQQLGARAMRQNVFASPLPSRSHVIFRMQNQPRTTIDILPGEVSSPQYMMQFYANQIESSGKNFLAFNMAELPQAPTIPLNRKRSEVRRVNNNIEPERKNSVGKKRKKSTKKKATKGSKCKRYQLFCGHCQELFYSKTTFRAKYNHHLVNHQCVNSSVRMQYVVGVRHRRCTFDCSPHSGCIRFTSK